MRREVRGEVREGNKSGEVREGDKSGGVWEGNKWKSEERKI